MAKFIRLGRDGDSDGVWINRDHIVSVRPLLVDDPALNRTKLLIEVKCTGLPLERIEVKAGTAEEVQQAWEALRAELDVSTG